MKTSTCSTFAGAAFALAFTVIAAQADSWERLPDGPGGRAYHSTVFTGDEAIVWGGWTGPANSPWLDTGARYDPVSKAWTPTTLVNAPSARFFNVPNAAVWTGDAMFIYGGFDYPISLNSASLYRPGDASSPIDDLVGLIARLDGAGLPRKIERPLVSALEAALRSLERGHDSAAANQLEAFQRKVQAQLAAHNPVLARSLIAAAQAIIDALAGG